MGQFEPVRSGLNHYAHQDLEPELIAVLHELFNLFKVIVVGPALVVVPRREGPHQIEMVPTGQRPQHFPSFLPWRIRWPIDKRPTDEIVCGNRSDISCGLRVTRV
jgi:hypothetical protein